MNSKEYPENIKNSHTKKTTRIFVPRLCVYCDSFRFTEKKIACDRDFWELDLDLMLVLIKGKKMRTYFDRGENIQEDFTNIFEYGSVCPVYNMNRTPNLKFDKIITKTGE